MSNDVFKEYCEKMGDMPDSVYSSMYSIIKRNNSVSLAWQQMKALASRTVDIKSVSLKEVLPDVYSFLFDYSHSRLIPDTCHWQLLIPMPFLYDLVGVSPDMTFTMSDNPIFRDVRLILGPSNDEKQIVAYVHGDIFYDEDWLLASRRPDHVIHFNIEF